MTFVVLSGVLLTSQQQGFAPLVQALRVQNTREVRLDGFKEVANVRPKEALRFGLLSDNGKFLFSRSGDVRFEFGKPHGIAVFLAMALSRGPLRLPLPLLALSPLPDGVERHGKVPGPGGLPVFACYGSPDGWRLWVHARSGGSGSIWDKNAPAKERSGALDALAEIDFRELKPQPPAISSFLLDTGFTSDMPTALVRDQATDRLAVLWQHRKGQQLGMVDSRGKITRFTNLVSGVAWDLVLGFDSRTRTLYQLNRSAFKIAALNVRSGKWRDFISLPEGGSSHVAYALSGGRFLVNSSESGRVILIERSGAIKRFAGLRIYGASASGKVVLVGGANLSDPARILFLR